MKIENIFKYTPPEGEEISRALPLNETDFAILNYSSSNQITINVFGNTKKQIDVSKIKKHNGLNGYCRLFKYKDGFGLAERFGKILLFPDINSNPSIIHIKSPYSKTAQPDQPFLSDVIYDYINNRFFLAIEDELTSLFPAKYWSTLQPTGKKRFGLNLPQKGNLKNGLNLLDIYKYPETSRGFMQGEWLSIQAICSRNGKLLVHTNGGAVTRSKSGPDYEFNIVSEIDTANKQVDNHIVDQGTISFSADNNYSLLILKGRKKILVYNNNGFKPEFEIPLTKKYVPAEMQINHISTDLLNNLLYLYDRNILSICRITV